LAKYLLGIDLGAGSLKATIITGTGVVAGEASQPITTSVPHFGWSEQDPAEWFTALCRAVPGAIAEAGIRADAIGCKNMSPKPSPGPGGCTSRRIICASG
jgi:xylulokinase